MARRLAKPKAPTRQAAPTALIAMPGKRKRSAAQLDPEDEEDLGDGTSALQREGWQLDGDAIPSGEGRLRMRAGVPELPEHRGAAVSRASVFGDDKERPEGVEGASSQDEDEAEAGMDGEMPAGFTISAAVEEEYQKMLEGSHEELEVMRQPSASEVASRTAEASELQGKMTMWKSMLEFRIHLEAALGLGHRLPVGDSHAALCSDAPASAESDKAATDVCETLRSLLALQLGVGRHRKLDFKHSSRNEDDGWSAIDTVLQDVLSWGLGVADEWKEHTRLDSRRSFKVLDQSLTAQMQAVVENAATMRKRSRPPPGKHSVFTLSADGADGGDAERAPGVGETHGAPETDTTPEEASVRHILDDRDFYVQLLREVLVDPAGRPSTEVSDDAKEARLMMESRRAHKKQAKKVVDRRASKGRKTRYVPIPKLENFMAPRTRRGDLHQELEAAPLAGEAAEALLRSLFRQTAAAAT